MIPPWVALLILLLYSPSGSEPLGLLALRVFLLTKGVGFGASKMLTQSINPRQPNCQQIRGNRRNSILPGHAVRRQATAVAGSVLRILLLVEAAPPEADSLYQLDPCFRKERFRRWAVGF